jgi:predicted nucleic acid-binding protein
MPDAGILDTSVVIDLSGIDGDLLPEESAITAVTLAELAAGPHATADAIQRSIRQERLQWAEATFDALPFDIAAARSYGRVYALVRTAGRQPRQRFADLMIASIAAANRLPLYTRNPTDFAGLEPLVPVIAV